MSRINTVLIANLGTSSEPVVKAIETAASEEGPLAIFLVYGREIGTQDKAPCSMISVLDAQAKQFNALVKLYEVDEPEKFERAFTCYKGVVEEVTKLEPSRVIVDVTGGTKVMAAALTQAVLTKDIGAEIVFEYVGGARGSNGRVNVLGDMVVLRDAGIVTRERMIAVIQSLHHQELARAFFLSRSLPSFGKALFLRQATEHFWRWDNFHYDDTAQSIDKIAIQAKVLIEDELLGKVADTLLRHKKHNANIKVGVSCLRQAKNDNKVVMSQGAYDGWIAICGDAIANARRRLDSEPIDCVLRCYRAVETTAQMAVFRLGVNPWKPDWGKLGSEVCSKLLLVARLKELPKNISLNVGVKLTQILTTPFTDKLNSDMENIMGSRNNSYLEHGYDKVPREAAEAILVKTEQVTLEIFSRSRLTGDLLSIANELRIEA
jgi:hypothetical protein